MKKYLITDPLYYTQSPNSFFEALNRSLLQYSPDFACFRDKSEGDKANLLNSFLKAVSGKGVKSLVNGSIDTALKYGFDGVHLRSDQLGDIRCAKSNSLLTITSTHTVYEAHTAFESGSDFITLSPVFESPNKAMPLGLKVFEDMLKELDKKRVFALGGIDDNDKLKELSGLGIFGFASIRYFVR